MRKGFLPLRLQGLLNTSTTHKTESGKKKQEQPVQILKRPHRQQRAIKPIGVWLEALRPIKRLNETKKTPSTKQPMDKLTNY